ncbi:hypothetical protein ANN_11912 [Periplaneta americana]|uniref:Uncharacterized protein n=1 Tax=Periplaneta americana TaxID=6978 RepID=A0ABQ8T6E0_PERAM|nr:hypothetical protein ANN_11912 [Periplaneta americana]
MILIMGGQLVLSKCQHNLNAGRTDSVLVVLSVCGSFKTQVRSRLHWLFNDAVSTTRLFSVDGIGDSEMIFGEMRQRIRHRLPCIHITVGENLGKNPTRTVSSQFTARLSWLVLLAQSLAFTESRTPDLQRRSAELRTQVPQLRSTALELRASGSTVTDTTQNKAPTDVKPIDSAVTVDKEVTEEDLVSGVMQEEGGVSESVVLCGCETWTLTLREEQRLGVFENKVLRKIFGALHPSPDIIMDIKSRRLRWAGHVARMGESRNAYRVLVGRPEGKRPLGRPRRRWEDNIKMDLREVGYDDACLHPLTRGGVLSTTVPEFPAFRNISARIHSLRALPRALRHLGRDVGMDPVLLGHLGVINLERWRVGGPHWVTGAHFDIGCHARIPTRNTILRWVASFRITGSTLKKKSPGRNSIALRLSEATVRSRALRLLSLGPFEGLLEDILFIDSNFKIVSKSITLLESSNLQISEALNMVYKVSQTVIQNSNSLISEKVKCYDGWINFENETQDRQECEREGKESGFSYDLLDGARTTFRGMVLRDQPGEYCRRNGRTYYEHVVVSAPK